MSAAKILISLIVLRLIVPFGFILIIGERFRAQRFAQLKT